MLDCLVLARIRNRSSIASSGMSTFYLFGTPILNEEIIVRNTEWCSDVVGNPGDNPLDIHKQEWTIKPLSGEIVFGSGTYRSLQCPPEYCRGASLGHLSLPSQSGLGTTALARTNPSRPAFNLPTFIGELRDLPHMFKVAGDTMLRKGANAFLSYQFGWKPLINDISKALDFSSAVRTRSDEWHRLYSDGGLKRRINLGVDIEQKKENDVVLHSSNGFVVASHTVITVRKTWATVRWRPDAGSLPPTTKSSSEKHARALLGLGVGGLIEGAWQLMPWSWMVDWFGNVGTFLQASNNTIGASPGLVNIMTTTTTNHQFSVKRDLSDGWIKGGDCSATVTSKARSQSSGPTFTASIPNLSGRQLSILGALGIQRVPRHLLR